MSEAKPIMRVTGADGESFWLDGHDLRDAYEAFGLDCVVEFYIAAPYPALCVDEGCDHYGTAHICETGEKLE